MPLSAPFVESTHLEQTTGWTNISLLDLRILYRNIHCKQEVLFGNQLHFFRTIGSTGTAAQIQSNFPETSKIFGCRSSVNKNFLKDRHPNQH